jgi:hypothetical protein
VSEETISSPSGQIREEREKKCELNPRRLLWPLSSWQDELMGVAVVHVAPEDPLVVGIYQRPAFLVVKGRGRRP